MLAFLLADLWRANCMRFGLVLRSDRNLIWAFSNSGKGSTERMLRWVLPSVYAIRSTAPEGCLAQVLQTYSSHYDTQVNTLCKQCSFGTLWFCTKCCCDANRLIGVELGLIGDSGVDR